MLIGGLLYGNGVYRNSMMQSIFGWLAVAPSLILNALGFVAVVAAWFLKKWARCC